MTYFLQAEAQKFKFWPQFLMDLADFFSVGFVFTRTIPIFGLCGVLIRSRRRNPQFSRCGGPNATKIKNRDSPSKNEANRKRNQSNPSKTVAKKPIIRLIVSSCRKSVIKSRHLYLVNNKHPKESVF